MNPDIILVKSDKWLQSICGSPLWMGESVINLKAELLLRRHLFLNPHESLSGVIRLLKARQNLISPLDLYGIRKIPSQLNILKIESHNETMIFEYRAIDFRVTINYYVGRHQEQLLNSIWLKDIK